MNIYFQGANRLSAAEKQQRYRARRDADPERREIYLKKEQQKYREDIASGSKKKVSDISKREKRRRRKKWRETYYSIKSRKEALKHLTTPPDTPQVSPDSTNPEPSTSRSGWELVVVYEMDYEKWLM